MLAGQRRELLRLVQGCQQPEEVLAELPHLALAVLEPHLEYRAWMAELVQPAFRWRELVLAPEPFLLQGDLQDLQPGLRPERWRLRTSGLQSP
jgi:hypothetical protein